MSRINTADELKQLNRVRFIADDVDQLKRLLVMLYGPFPMSFSSPAAIEQGKADVVIVDVLDPYAPEDMSGIRFPGGQAIGYIATDSARGRLISGSAEDPRPLMVIKTEAWDIWVKPAGDRNAGLAADAAHPGVPE